MGKNPSHRAVSYLVPVSDCSVIAGWSIVSVPGSQ
jgi:hypothetical protein